MYQAAGMQVKKNLKWCFEDAELLLFPGGIEVAE